MPLLHLTDAEYAEHLLRLRSGQVKNTPECPLWQSLEWKRYQETLGRETRLYGASTRASTRPAARGSLSTAQHDTSATALVIIDKTAFGLSTWDIPRGPLGDSPEVITELLGGIVEEAGKEGCMALYFSPAHGFPNYKLQITNYKLQIAERHEQPEATLVLDLTLSDDDLLRQMKPKGRYNIRLSQRHGVAVEETRDTDAFYALLERTAKRDGFTIKPKRHYELFLRELPGSFLLLAYPNPSPSPLAHHSAQRDGGSPSSNPLAALLGIIHEKTGYYYYGASSHEHRSLMAPYALQWEAMKLCRERGCTTYDLLGIGPHWLGATRFKEQFGGRIVTYPPEREIVFRPVTQWLIGWKRRIHG